MVWTIRPGAGYSRLRRRRLRRGGSYSSNTYIHACGDRHWTAVAQPPRHHRRYSGDRLVGCVSEPNGHARIRRDVVASLGTAQRDPLRTPDARRGPHVVVDTRRN